VADQHHPAALDPSCRQLSPDVGKGVAGQRHEIVGDGGDIMFEVRTLRVRALVSSATASAWRRCLEQLCRFGLEPGHFRIDVDFAALAVSRSSAIRWSSAAIGFSNSR
jgi:hypothetical protein